MTDIEVIKKIDKLEVALFAAENSHYKTSNRGLQNLLTQHEKMEMDLKKLDRKVGYIRRSLTTVLVALGFIVYEVIKHWVL